jgi:hypothetical protein
LATRVRFTTASSRWAAISALLDAERALLARVEGGFTVPDKVAALMDSDRVRSID